MVRRRVIDADNHYYEPDDCFTRHIDPSFRARTVHVIPDPDDGLGRVFIGDRRARYMSVTPTDYSSPPGALQGVFEGNYDAGYEWEAAINAREHPALMNRDARLKLMDQQGIERIVQLPTLGVVVEHEMRDDPQLVHASLSAFNRWMEEDWGYAYLDRIYAVPLLSLLHIDLAVAELDRVLAAGARLVYLKPGPQGRRSPADPMFDPFWARVEEAGVPVVFHVSNSGYNDLIGEQWSEAGSNASHRQSPLQWALFNTERPIVDTLAALVLHNLFGRFPGVRVASIENGSDWVAHLFKMMEKAIRMTKHGPMLGGPLADAPTDIFKEHVFVCPFPEDDVPALIDTVGPDRVLFGSDYPHPEGMRVPLDFVDFLQQYDPITIDKVMYATASTMLGLEATLSTVQ